MNIFTSRAIEPRKSTWEKIGKRFQNSEFDKQEEWMDDCLKRAGFNPKEWMETGEMPSEMICRFASQSKKYADINDFLLAVMK